ncbi:hypothetical protein ACFLSQ_06540 [Bacteroidota bacterium]
MKKIISHKITLLLIIIVASIGLILCSEQKETKIDQTPQIIQSTIDGGDWNDPATWHGGIVPDKIYDVAISGRVMVSDKAECLNLMVDTDGYLDVKQNAVLKIYHHVINLGTIVNNGEITVVNENEE